MQSDRSLLTRSMITEGSLSTNSVSTNFRSRLHRSAGSINLCDDAMGTSSPLPPTGQKGPLSMITSDANNTSPVLKNPTRLGKGKPRQLKRRRATGIHSKSASVEPHPDELSLALTVEAPIFRDDCSMMVYSQSIDHSFTASPTANVRDNVTLSPHRRTRSASGSNTRLGSLWSFICNGNSACTSTRRANDTVAVPP